MKLPKIIRDRNEVDRILRDKTWRMPTAMGPVLGQLLGDGVIMAHGPQHAELRRQLGALCIPDLKRIVLDFTPTAGVCDIHAEMMRLSETVISEVLGAPKDALLGVSKIVRRCVALAPFRLLGLRLDRAALKELDEVLNRLPTPPWLVGVNLTDKELRDWKANFVVAGLDTTAADTTAQLVHEDLLPIWWLPRCNTDTGELVILMLSPEHKFGAGFRRCVGVHIATELAFWVRGLLVVEVYHLNLRRTGLITQRLASVRGTITKRARYSSDNDLP